MTNIANPESPRDRHKNNNNVNRALDHGGDFYDGQMREWYVRDEYICLCMSVTKSSKFCELEHHQRKRNTNRAFHHIDQLSLAEFVFVSVESG